MARPATRQLSGTIADAAGLACGSRAAPVVQLGSLEPTFAAWGLLLERDRPFGGHLVESTDRQINVGSGAFGIEPSVLGRPGSTAVRVSARASRPERRVRDHRARQRSRQQDQATSPRFNLSRRPDDGVMRPVRRTLRICVACVGETFPVATVARFRGRSKGLHAGASWVCEVALDTGLRQAGEVPKLRAQGTRVRRPGRPAGDGLVHTLCKALDIRRRTPRGSRSLRDGASSSRPIFAAVLIL
jgi:hypothetical protein